LNFVSVDGSPSALTTLSPGQLNASFLTAGIWQTTKTAMMIP
jgi:hypothetical protein